MAVEVYNRGNATEGTLTSLAKI